MTTQLQPTGTPPPVRWGSLPHRLRVLFVTTHERTGGWLTEAFAGDRAVELVLEEAVGMAAAMTRLRETVFDAVLVSHEPGELDALQLGEALRGGGAAEPLIVLGHASEVEMSPLCYEVGIDAYVCIHATSVRLLIWHVARAVERHALRQENQRLQQGEKHRLRLEHQETQRLLDEQRAMLRDLETLREPAAKAIDWANTTPASSTIARVANEQQPLELPPELVDHYRDLLRAYVIMGSGNLGREMNSLAELLCRAEITAAQTMQLHLQALEDLIRGLGSRSARHVMSRADLLILEVLVHVSEGYRRRVTSESHPTSGGRQAPDKLASPGCSPCC